MKKTKEKKPNKIAGFAKKVWAKIRKRKWLWIAAAVVLGIIIAFSGSSKKSASGEYATVVITRGNLKQVVTATGEIKPLNTIKVGSQVSGNIEKIFVDFNDTVKKGDILLTIDPSVLQASADEAKASLDSAESQRNFDKSEYNRSKTLFDDGFIARAEMEQAKTKFETSEQSVKRAKSQYERALTNLGYATIASPVDGTVISRKVDKGQTVQASFSAPDLFEIAEDLSKMKIETSVSEADIGIIKNGQSVSFTVDAYPTQTFNGAVKQIRLSPTTTSNVVVYTVVIDVDNSDLRLMPGMTAFVTITVEEKSDVWKAANSAFLVRDFKATFSDNAGVQNGDITPKTYLAIQKADGKKIDFVSYKKGLITATETEIIADGLEKGDKIITGKIGAAAAKAGTGGQQFGSRSGGGAPGGGMGGGPR
ncbi:MAG: efflux RND transporter periplasmic adaptor subunit [Rickettsiales bacterium]|jgi:HlyD family secretion protein|nr:efflux RND transporter periplasmic adaptor subunit [Rickettsiales bacterium]